MNVSRPVSPEDPREATPAAVAIPSREPLGPVPACGGGGVGPSGTGGDPAHPYAAAGACGWRGTATRSPITAAVDLVEHWRVMAGLRSGAGA